MFIASVSAFSCGVCRRTLVPIKDSVIVERVDSVIYRDTTIFVQIPKEVVREIVPADSTSIIETSFAESRAEIIAGKLHHELRHKDDAIIPIKTFLPYRVISQSRSAVLNHFVVRNELTSFQTFFVTLGKIAGLVTLFLIVSFIIKKFHIFRIL